jgi:hypothetical protein
VDFCAGGNVLQGQAVADDRRRLGAAFQRRADLEPIGRQDETADTVGIHQQRDIRTAIRVVLDGLDPCADAVFFPAEVDQPVLAFVPATPVSRGDDPLVVAPGFLAISAQEFLGRFGPRGQFGKVADGGVSPAGGRRIVFSNSHGDRIPCRGLEEVDPMFGLEFDDRFFPGFGAPFAIAISPRFAASILNRDLVDLDVEQFLHGLADLRFGRKGVDFEGVLVEFLGLEHPLFGDARADDDLMGTQLDRAGGLFFLGWVHGGS